MPRALWKLPILALRENLTPAGRTRQLEPMVMDEPDSVAQFHAGGAKSSGMRAVHDLSARCLDRLLPEGGRLLDLGCGSGRALAYLAQRRPDITAVGVDLAPNMLAFARELTQQEGLADRIRLVQADISQLPEELLAEPFDAVSTIWTLHHLPDDATLGAVFGQIAAVRAKWGSAVWIMDFQRLHNPASFSAGMRVLEPGTDPRLSQDAIASEAASFTLQELTSAAKAAGLTGLHGGCCWPIPWQQAHWLPSSRHSPRGSSRWRPLQLQGAARVDAVLLRRGFSGLPI